MDYKILFKYLKIKIDNFKYTQGTKIMFTCPNLKSHLVKEENPTATFMNGTDKIYCFICGWKGTFIDVVKLLEPEKQSWTDSKIISTIDTEANLKLYPEMDMYLKNKWSLMKCPQNDKKPYPGIAFSEETHYNKDEWILWVDQKCNIALRTGDVSNITVLDLDIYKPLEDKDKSLLRQEIHSALEALGTLKQSSPHGGIHYFIKYDADFKNKANFGDLYLDCRNNNGYVLVQPSNLDNIAYKFENLKSEIKQLPKELKEKILSLTKNQEEKKSESIEQSTKQEKYSVVPELQHNNLSGCCNDTFVQFAGVLKKLGLSGDLQKSILYYLNKNWLAHPMKPIAIDAMLGSINDYIENEEKTVEQAVYDYLKMMKEVTIIDVVDTCFLGDKKKKALINKYLAQFVKEGKAVRLRVGHYMYKEKIEWEAGKEFEDNYIDYKIPYFSEISHFMPGSIIILGAPTGCGKTTIAMNFVKQFKEQGIKPYYLNLESTSGFQITAKELGLTMDDFMVPKEEIINPIHMELEKNRVTIVDFLDLSEDFTATGTIMKYFREEMTRKSGILIILTQTRPSNNDWFAKDLILQVSRLAARFVLDDDTGKRSHFEIDKMTFPIGNIRRAILNTQFDPNTKLLTLKQ